MRMNDKLLSFCVILFSLLALAVLGCQHSMDSGAGDPSDVIAAITETDTSGRFVGNIDLADWSPQSYSGLYVGKELWYQLPRHWIDLSPDSFSTTIHTSWSFYVFGKRPIVLNAAVSAPFSVSPNPLTIQPRTMDSIIISCPNPDSLHSYASPLFLHFSSGELDTLGLRARINSGSVEPIDNQIPVAFSLYPAYPNPVSGNTTLRLTTPIQRLVQLTVTTSLNDTVATVLNQTLPAGMHEVRWDLKNKGGQKVSPGLYNVVMSAGSYTCRGHLLVQ